MSNSDIGNGTGERLHVAIMRTVRPGRERHFVFRIEEFFRDAAREPGVGGAYLIRPFSRWFSRRAR